MLEPGVATFAHSLSRETPLVIVLGIQPDPELREAWREWLAPDLQPFFVESLRGWPKSLRDAPLGAELRHTYKAWKVDRSLSVLWLDEDGFRDLPGGRRTALVRAQVDAGRGAVPSVRRWSDELDAAVLRSHGDGHRFVWWPSLVAIDASAILSRVITSAPAGAEAPAQPSRHHEVAGSTWAACARALPDARRLAGTFPRSSGPNCFGTVMAAAGVAGADDECVLEATFLAWVDGASAPGGCDEEAGTVLVWRNRAGTPVHAAVTIGDGWALEKASGEWWTPRAVRAVADVIRATRARGQRLERRRIALP